ncbi:MAG: glyoxylase family protein [Actinomycetota bacterium]|jgi:catechol 2,3-dioxygenase-like lactoylglutathione lyase family enzyme|nr:glyoxylase family protein [Actinomycetota bacterium]
MPDITGLSHLTLTVTDVDRSLDWYQQLLGVQMIFEGEEPENAVTRFVVTIHPTSALILGLRKHRSTADERFDETKVGMDHVAFQVGSRAVMDEWVARLDELGIEHSGVKDAAYGSVITFRDPDNIQLELFALPGT